MEVRRGHVAGIVVSGIAVIPMGTISAHDPRVGWLHITLNRNEFSQQALVYSTRHGNYMKGFAKRFYLQIQQPLLDVCQCTSFQ